MRTPHPAVTTLFTIFVLALPQRAHAQGSPPNAPAPASGATGEIRGRIVDAATGTGVGVGSVAVRVEFAGALADPGAGKKSNELSPGEAVPLR